MREQFDLFVVVQRAQPVLCYHKKVGQKENLFLKIELSCLVHDTRNGQGREEGRRQGRPSMGKQGKAKNNSWHPSTSRARQGEHAGEAQQDKHRQGQSSARKVPCRHGRCREACALGIRGHGSIFGKFKPVMTSVSC